MPDPVSAVCSISQGGTAAAATTAVSDKDTLKAFEVASRQAFNFAANESAGDLSMMQHLQATLINFGRLARSGAQATAASLPKADAKGPSTTNPSVPAASGRRAHKGDRLTKGSDPVFKATIIKLQGEKVILENELRALYERTGEAVPKTTALPKKSCKNGAKRANIAPPERVPIGAGPEAPKDLSGPISSHMAFQDQMALQREKWRRMRSQDGSPGTFATDGSVSHTPVAPAHTPMVPDHTPVVFALSPQEAAHVAMRSSTNHTEAGSGIHAQEDRATPNGAPHVVGCRVVDVRTQEGEKEVVEMLTCADLVHGKEKCIVVRGRLPVDPEILTGRQVDLEEAWMRNNWTTFKATGMQKHERKRVNGDWDYTGQLEMEFYPKGTRKATIEKGDSDKRIMAMIDPGREGAGVVTLCGWMIHGFSSLEGGNFLKARADSDSDSD